MNSEASVTELHPQVDENEASRRRRAIFKALQPYMTQTQLLEALWMWEWDFAEGAAFELANYLRTICLTAELKAQQSEIRRSLIRQMSLPLSALGPDPWPLMRNYAQSMKMEEQQISVPASTPVEKSEPRLEAAPGTEVLVFVITHVLDAMLQKNPVYCAKVRNWVAGHLVSIVPVAHANEFSEWLVSQTLPPTAALAPGVMSRIVNLLYICGCEYFGPVQVDKMLHLAISAAEALPVATRFNPRDLL
ncbi:MAG: hypothetical protein LJE56_02480 [Acidiferrobacterales bacterium]|jgi:hypothetical protein|nr:hypothetical protein [Acidiferrobacterales bacterium]